MAWNYSVALTMTTGFASRGVRPEAYSGDSYTWHTLVLIAISTLLFLIPPPQNNWLCTSRNAPLFLSLRLLHFLRFSLLLLRNAVRGFPSVQRARTKHHRSTNLHQSSHL